MSALTKQFWEAILYGELKTLQLCIDQDRDLVNTCSKEGFPPIASIFYKCDNYPEVIKLLLSHGANVDPIICKRGDMPLDMTPLAYFIWQTPYLDRGTKILLEHGANIHHPSVTQVIELAKTCKYVDSEYTPQRSSINKILKLRNEQPIEFSHPNLWVGTPEPTKDINSVITGIEKRYVHKATRWDRSNNRNYEGYRLVALDFTVNDENQELILLMEDSNTGETSSNWRFTTKLSQGVVLDVLSGYVSPKEVFEVFLDYLDCGFMDTKMGSFLLTSIGHPTGLASSEIRIIDNALETKMRSLCGVTSVGTNLESIQYTLAALQIKYAKLLASNQKLINTQLLGNKFESRMGDKVAIDVISVELINKQLIVTSRLNYNSMESKEEHFVFDYPGAGANICLDILAGFISPDLVKNVFSYVLGYDSGFHNTYMGQFLNRCPGFLNMYEEADIHQVISPNIVNYFF